ncbi:cobalt ABC transporter permease [Fructobacillus sp. CRL 2054]|uniref:energy-coupling factor transporter transmembrane component T family protein n=1 Tax=Fructobacillus sp. CRL 2054 TaxID=2763007 RepID=UPI002378B769|nr:energy-coupling factor transporter transmembrane component T [Fructobacillus sp. CRL 2054]MDD9138877.1 cobalt ABC transporter permease [Fructobacillus sp. CRL 2054]
MNASQRLYLSLLISLEVALTQSFTLNVVLYVFFIGLLLFQGIRIQRILRYLFIALLPTLATFWSFYLYSVGNLSERLHTAYMMGSRVGLFIFVGAWLTNVVSPSVLLKSLEENLKLSATFIYGMLAALNFIPRFKQTFRSIQAASYMRGQAVHWYQPTLYFKALIHAIRWSEMLAMAMTSHGFQEGATRTRYRSYPYQKFGFVWIALIMCSTFIVLYLSQY